MLKDLWIVGDDFSKEIYYSLRAMRMSASQHQQHQRQLQQQIIAHRRLELELYIHRFYNVREFHLSKKYPRDHILARLVNAFIDGLNENPILPRIVLLKPDENIIQQIKYTGFGVSMIIGKCIHWLMNGVDDVINRRIQALSEKKPGALSSGEPIVVLVKLLERPTRDQYELVRSKFNVFLGDTIQQIGGSRHKLIQPTEVNGIQRNMFDVNHNRHHEGRITYWRKVSEEIRRIGFSTENDKHLTAVCSHQPRYNQHHNPPGRSGTSFNQTSRNGYRC